MARHSGIDRPIQDELIRKFIRMEKEKHERRMAVFRNGGSVRTTLMKIAFDEYSELPDNYRQVYFPEEHCILLDLPEPETEQSNQKSLSISVSVGSQ